MYISADRKYLKNAWKLLLLTLFFGLFGAVYEIFSHEVYSYFMLYSWAIPMVLGVLPYIFCAIRKKAAPGNTFFGLWNCGILTLTVGCAFQGVLEIYGTTNWKTVFFWIAGGLLLIAAVIFLIINKKNNE